MIFDMETLAAQNRYKILTATVTPRPIAWVTTISASGVINAAPFSFFNVMGHEPPTVAIGLLAGSERFKDTAANILDTGEFVVNLVAERNAEAMNITCIDAPPEIDELTLAGLTPAASQAVRPPRIAESAGVVRMPGADVAGDGAAADRRHRPDRSRSCRRCGDPRQGALSHRYPGASSGRPHAWQRLVCALHRPVPDRSPDLGGVAGKNVKAKPA